MIRRTQHAIAWSIAIATATVALAGPLTPPAGAPSSTDKPLAQIEPRTAINTQNTPGDANSVFRITQSGSYYLTGNIPPVGAGRFAIEVNAANVTIDLNGFTINGINTETLAAVGGSGSFGLHVHNGLIENWNSTAIAGNGDLLVERVHFDLCGSGTVVSASSMTIKECSFRGSSPIVPTDGTLIIGCRFRNQNDAIEGPAAEGVVVIDTVIDGQNTAGSDATIELGDGAVLSRVVIAEEGQNAVLLGNSALVDRCVFTGQATGAGNEPGITVGSNSVVIHSVVQDFGGVGIFAAAGSRIEGNSVFSCTEGGIDAATSLIANNVLESNGAFGIDALNGCLIVNNVIRSTAGNGIEANNDNTIRGNALDGDPIRAFGADNVIDSNTITDAGPNPIIIDSSSNLVIRNMFSTGTIAVVGTNTIAATVSGSAAVNGAGPFANIQY